MPRRDLFWQGSGEATLGEASLLAGLPQLPPITTLHTSRPRQETSGHRARPHGRGRLHHGGGSQRGLGRAAGLRTAQFDLKAPHFTLFVRQQLEQLFGPEALYQSGYSVRTTLDPRLQAEAERIVREQVSALADRNVSNGALVAMRPQNGEVVALVGSADFDNVEIDGQVNMALARASPAVRSSPLSTWLPLTPGQTARGTVDAGLDRRRHHDPVPGWHQPALCAGQLRRQRNGVDDRALGTGDQPQHPGRGGLAENDAAGLSGADAALWRDDVGAA